MPSPFDKLPGEVQSRVVDFLDFQSITFLRATCRAYRALPTELQRRDALVQFEKEMEEAWTLFMTLNLEPQERILWLAEVRNPEVFSSSDIYMALDALEIWKELAAASDILRIHADWEVRGKL